MKLLSFLLVTCLIGVFATSCKDDVSIPRLDEIIDMSDEETMSLKLTYDAKGSLVKLGAADILYQKNRIVVTCKDTILGYGRSYENVFNLKNDRVISSESHCDEYIGGKIIEVNKKSTFTYSQNQIIVDSKSYDFKNNRLLKTHHEIRELGQDGKLVKVISQTPETGESVALYKYNSNLACNANLNLQAFSYSANGLDDLLAYLLNLIKIPYVNVLPDEVSYTYLNGQTHLFNENYSLDDDRLTKLEIMKNYEELVSRLNFKYKSIKH